MPGKTPPPPADMTSTEAAIYDLQREISRAMTSTIRKRDRLLAAANAAGSSQRRLAEVMTAAALAEGGKPLTEDAAQRAIRLARAGEREG